MKQNSTHETATLVAQKVSDRKNLSAEPRQSTIDFLKQFARAYQCQPRLKSSLSGFYVN